jgi:quercetin dioxygenase-like cupin family protein
MSLDVCLVRDRAMITAQRCATKGEAMFVVDLDELELDARGPGPFVDFPIHSLTGAASTAAVLIELEPGGELPRHTDSAEELLIVLQGAAEASVGDETGRLERHQVALVPAMVPHFLRNVGDENLRVLGSFSSSMIVATFEQPLGPESLQVFAFGAPIPIPAPLKETVPA